MKFSLIVCTYMRPKPLQNLLESVNAQVLYPDEILIIDGSHDDATKTMLDANPFENLTYCKVPSEHRGLTKQRNYGIARVGEQINIICFLDDDIVLTENYFKELIGTYTIHPDTLGVGGYITNEVSWEKGTPNSSNRFEYDGWHRAEPSRFRLRKKLGLVDDTKPCFLPEFSHGRSVGFLPPSGKIYPAELFMGGVSSFKKEIFNTISFSTYFEGYGLYEDADFTLRLSKKGKLYVNTAAQLMHYHDASGRPNQFNYGKMVVKNGWYVWRVKYPKPSFKARYQWNATVLFLTFIRFTNIITQKEKMKAFTEACGRLTAWFSLWFSKPKHT